VAEVAGQMLSGIGDGLLEQWSEEEEKMSSSGRKPGPSQMLHGQSSGQPQGVESPCIEVLRKTPLFARLTDEQLRIIAPLCRQLPVCRGRMLFRKGDEAQEIYMVLEGQIYLEEEIPAGQDFSPRTILVEKVYKNDAFGLCALVEPRRAMLSARCTGDADLVAMNSNDLRALMKAHPAIGLVVMENAFQIAYQRLVHTHHRIITELGLPIMYETYRNY
jgi:CRP/FNR family cyclic AMP-dependent transcriptional regulator